MACLRPADDPFTVRMGYVAQAIRTLATARIARSIPGTVGTRLPASSCPGVSTQSQLDQPSFDDVLGGRRILLPIEGLHPFVLRQTKRFPLDLQAPRSSRFPCAGEPHNEEQRWLPHHHLQPRPDRRRHGRLIIAEARTCHRRHGRPCHRECLTSPPADRELTFALSAWFSARPSSPVVERRRSGLSHRVSVPRSSVGAPELARDHPTVPW